MSIENSAIHYIKDTMFGDFYLNNPLENKPLGRIFCQMVEFKSLENITYLSPTSVFMQDMLKAFEEFDQNLNPPGLISQQFTALAQKCADKGVKVLIGEDPNLSKILGISIETEYLNDHYIFINISEELVKKAMENPIYVIQKECNNIPEIKAIPLGNLVAGKENVNFDDPTLIGKCAAYLLFHELFHLNSYYFEFDNKEPLTNPKKFKGFHKFPENVEGKDIDFLMAGGVRFDDLRNVTGAKTEKEIRVPGEYELLQALYHNKKIMRLYEGKFLDFSKVDVLNAAVKVARFENDCLNSKSDLQQNLNNRNLSCELEKILNDKKIQFNKIELNDCCIKAKFEDECAKLASINTQLKSYIQMEEAKIKVDTGVWEAQANLYIKKIDKILEEAEMKKNTLKKAYIPC